MFPFINNQKLEKTVIIIGAGIAGLSTGCYAQMNGFKTRIFEMHNIPGGLCTAWTRKGYKFDISMHLLTGSLSGSFHKMWKELGVIDNFKFHYHDHFLKVESGNKSLVFCDNKSSLEEQMLSISPRDSRLIKEFTGLIFGGDLMDAASINPTGMQTFSDKLRILPAFIPLMKAFIKYRRQTVQEFAEKFTDPFLRNAVRFLIDAPGWAMPDYPMVGLKGFVKNGMTKSGVPLGGSQQVIFRIADMYSRLGGELVTGKKVKDLIINDNRALGVILEDGSEIRSDYVVWAADGHTLIYDILGGRYIDETIENMYRKWIPVKPIMHVMIGVNRDFSGEPHKLVFELPEPEVVAGTERKWLSILHHSFDQSMAPPGKSVVEAWFETEYEYWEDLYKDREAYKAEKSRIAEMVIGHLDRRFPGFRSQVEVVDVPTPVTYRRYTGNMKGSPDGWAITNTNFTLNNPVRKLPGLIGLYMAGQWTAPYTGTVIAALSGRQVIQFLCRKERKSFATS